VIEMDSRYRVKAVEVIKNVEEAPGINSLYLKPMSKIGKPKPGQFFMVWVPDYEEVPMSVSGLFDEIIRITVAKVGETTSFLTKIDKGFLGLKGPFGTHIPLSKNKSYLLIGGGYGVAPLIFATHEILEMGGEVSIIIAAKTKKQIIFSNEAEKVGANVYIATEDGSMGFKGDAIELAERVLREEEFDLIVSCGPLPMLENLARKFYHLRNKIFLILEEIMKCGMGLCGSCELKGTGILVCKDGPVIRCDKIFLRIY